MALEALTGEKTIAEIAREYQIHPIQVSQWERAIIDRLPGYLKLEAQSIRPSGKWPGWNKSSDTVRLGDRFAFRLNPMRMAVF